MPRPRVLTPERCRELIAYVTAGLRVEHAARYVGCSVRTVRREADRNDEFRIALAAAELGVRSDPEKLMNRAAGSYWRAAAWMLERRDPHRFGRRRSDACGPQELEEICTTLIDVALAAASDDQARRALYLKMTASLREMTTDLFPAPLAARPSFNFHHYTDEQRMLDRVDQTNEELRRFWGEPPQAKPPGTAAGGSPAGPAREKPTAPPAASGSQQPGAKPTASRPTPRPQAPSPDANHVRAASSKIPPIASEFLKDMKAHRLAMNVGDSFRPTGQDNSLRSRPEAKSSNSPRAERNGHPRPAGGEE